MSFKARRLPGGSAEAFCWERLGAAVPHHAASLENLSPDPDASLRLATLERDAFAKGYAQGERAGAEAASTRADGMLRRLGQTVEELAALRGEIIRRTERQAVQLVLAIAERIVHREVTLDRSLLIGMARAALDRLGEYGSATIRLHPEDLRAIGAVAAFDSAQVRILADPVVTRGGCLVQSDFGFMDVSPESQFRELARTLLSDADAPSAGADVSHGIVLK
jgi:flagellar assembly protein FliH